MSTLGFDNYVEPLKLYLQKYREGMKGENKVRALRTQSAQSEYELIIGSCQVPILTR